MCIIKFLSCEVWFKFYLMDMNSLVWKEQFDALVFLLQG